MNLVCIVVDSYDINTCEALPIWVDYMSLALKNLPTSEVKIPSGISYVKVNKSTGEIANPDDKNTYFELFLNENIDN